MIGYVFDRNIPRPEFHLHGMGAGRIFRLHIKNKGQLRKVVATHSFSFHLTPLLQQVSLMVLVQDIPVQRSRPWPIGQYKPMSTLPPRSINASSSCWPRETASSVDSRTSCFDRLMQHVNDCIQKEEEQEEEDDDLDINLPKIKCYRHTCKGILVHPTKYSTVSSESLSTESISTFASSSSSSWCTRRDSDNSTYSSSSTTSRSVRFTSEPPRIHCTPSSFSFMESSSSLSTTPSSTHSLQ